jgi:hypothetical protein
LVSTFVSNVIPYSTLSLEITATQSWMGPKPGSSRNDLNDEAVREFDTTSDIVAIDVADDHPRADEAQAKPTLNPPANGTALPSDAT